MKIEINPSFVTFEQAKLLKSKDYDILTNNHYYDEKGNLNFCQTYSHVYKEIEAGRGKYITAPEQWQVVEWLRVNHGIWIVSDYYNNGDKDIWFFNCKTKNKEIMDEGFNSPQEATSEGIIYTLKNLL